MLTKELRNRDIKNVKSMYARTNDPSHQKLRQEIYEDFRAGTFRYLVATNLMGRGIDIDKVNYVINFDMPMDKDTYLHRVGRAGRQETNGVSISFVVKADDKFKEQAKADEEVLSYI